MHKKSLGIFISATEWLMCTSLVSIFSLMAATAEDLIVCGSLVATLAMVGGIAVSITWKTRNFQRAWFFGGIVLAAMAALVSFVVQQILPFLIAFPILGTLYLHRLIRLRNTAEPNEVMAKWFRIESLLIPCFIWACVQLPANPILPRYLWVLAALGAYITRMVSMILLSRVGNEKKVSQSVQELLRVGAVALVVVILMMLVPYLLYVADIGFPLLLAAQNVSLTARKSTSQSSLGGSPGGGSLRDNMHLQSVSHFVIPHWVYYASGAIAVFIVAMIWMRKHVEDELYEEKGVSVILERERWLPNILSLLDTTSFVREQYQRFVRLMADRNLEPKQAETTREYGTRVGSIVTDPKFRDGVQGLTDAYESVRYGYDLEEPTELRKRAELSIRSVEQVLNKVTRDAK